MKKARRQAVRHPPQTGVAKYWKIQRATGIGVVTGFLAIMIAGLSSLSRDGLLYPYAALLAVTAFCGASILWITMFDMRTRGTSGRMRPIRGFDIAIALALMLPSLYALSLIWSDLGL